MAGRPTQRASGEDRLGGVHDQLVTAVEALTSSEAWLAMLRVAARFPTYSPSNVLLIGMQRPDATRVAGIRTWNAVGRRVRKGEHGIAILAPCIYRNGGREDAVSRGADDDDNGPAHSKASIAGHGAGAAPSDEGPVHDRELRGFRVVHVFDVTQTEGDPLPDTAPALLTGTAPTWLWDHLTGEVARAGFTLERGPCGGANGWTDPTRLLVRVREDVEPLQAVKTLAHELGHIRAEHATRFPQYAVDSTCRGQAEIEAESIAYLVLAQAGLDATDYSVPYLAGWCDGEAGRLRNAMTTVLRVARGLATDSGQQGAPPGAPLANGEVLSTGSTAGVIDVPSVGIQSLRRHPEVGRGRG